MGTFQQDGEVEMRSQLTRRRLLKRSAAFAGAAAAAPFVITSNALGSRTKPPASERITLGFIGAGERARYSLIPAFVQFADVECVVLCDTFGYRRHSRAAHINNLYSKNFRTRSTRCGTCRDFRDVLSREDIDAVVIATPDHWHVPMAIEAARVGKDMYLEKPLGVSIAQGRTLRKAINEHHNIFQFGTQQRSDRNFRFACELVRNRKIGKLHTIHVWCPQGEVGGSATPCPVPGDLDYNMWLGPAPKKPYTKDRCLGRGFRKGVFHVYDYTLGFISGWGIHPLDIAQWANDADNTGPVQYEGVGRFPEKGLYNTAVEWDVKCLYANGVKLHFMSETIARPIVQKYHPKPANHGTTFVGDEGWVSVDRMGIYAEPASVLDCGIRADEIRLYKSDNQMRNFIDCVRSRRQTISPIEAAVRGDTICHLSDIAVRTGRKIKWDGDAEVIIGDPIAERMTTRAMRAPWRL